MFLCFSLFFVFFLRDSLTQERADGIRQNGPSPDFFENSDGVFYALEVNRAASVFVAPGHTKGYGPGDKVSLFF